MKITILAENSGWEELEGEHGLSLLIEHQGKKILLDAGQSMLFYNNSKKLGINLEEIDWAVLSHSHYDHADGFESFFENNSRAQLYVNRNVCEDFYADDESGARYIGPKKGMLEHYRDRVVYVDKEKYCLDNACETGKMYLIAHSTPGLEKIGEKAKLCKMVEGKMIPDDFNHEQSLVIETQKGLVIFNSCSHGAPANIINEVLKNMGNVKIYAYIGGFHLSHYPDEEIYKFADILKKLDIERIVTGHCTGDRAFDILAAQIGSRMEKMHSGLVINI